MFYEDLKGHVEALLFVSGEPLPSSRIAGILGIDKENVEELIYQLMEDMDQEDRGLTILRVAGGFQLCTKPQLAPTLEKLAQTMEEKLSAPALETLSIIAFQQPITKQEIENIRGVRIDRVLARLLDLGLIQEQGRKECLGRPILYGTTEGFLKCFGLNCIEDLPQISQLKADDFHKSL